MTSDLFDVIVVGGGAAGLSGAVALLRARRRVLVIDSGAPRNAPAAHAHNFLTRDGTPPLEILRLGRAEVAHYGGALIKGRVVTIKPRSASAEHFRVVLEDGRNFTARRLLIATGLRDELPAIPGVAELWGRDVLHCPYCHGWEVQDQALGILGTNPFAVHGALLWRQWSADVVLFQHTAPALSADEQQQLAARNIRVIDEPVAGLEISAGRLHGVRLASGSVVPRQAVVVASRLHARAAMLGELGLEAVEQVRGGISVGTAIEADPLGATSVAGVWVAGNVSDPFGQVVGAAAEGLRAGAAINADLSAEETAAACAALA